MSHIHVTLFAAKKKNAMSFDGFQMYLCSLEGSIFKPELRELHQDMGQPLSHYFISSSHNTYLMEDQLRGHSSLEAYIQWEQLQPAHTLFICSIRGEFRQQLSVNTILKISPICDKTPHQVGRAVLIRSQLLQGLPSSFILFFSW